MASLKVIVAKTDQYDDKPMVFSGISALKLYAESNWLTAEEYEQKALEDIFAKLETAETFWADVPTVYYKMQFSWCPIITTISGE